MNSRFATAVCRAITVFICLVAVVVAPFASGLDCRQAGFPAKCNCCEDPQAGCCAAKQQGSEEPVPFPPAKTMNLRDVAPVPLTVVAVLPPFVPREFPNTSSDAADCAPHVARHSFLCIRTV
jgi:hypothetical protein